LLSAVASSVAACGHPDLLSGLTIITIQIPNFGHLLSKIISKVGMLFLSHQNEKEVISMA